MSDPVRNDSFDVEAQQSLLANNPPQAASGLSDYNAETTSTLNARQTLHKFILLIRSTEIFKLGANYAADISRSSSSTSSTGGGYISITNSDQIHSDQGSGIVAALEISAGSTQEDTLISTHSAAAEEYERRIDLQSIQRKKITEIVKKKDLLELRNYGGVRGVAEALNTDLEKGISNPQQTYKCKPNQLSQILLAFFQSFLEACNNYTVLLLSCAAILTLGFGIKEEGLDNMGWFNGGVLFFTIFIIVTCTTIHKCLEKISKKKLENSYEYSNGIEVLVVRAGEFQFIRETDIEVGDLAVLRKGDQVPADGLFITAQSLEVDDGSTKPTTIDETNPFLFYGSRVVNGNNAQMLVTSTGMDTAWAEMMSQAILESSADNNCKLESYIHNLNTCTHIAGLLISILIIIVLFLRYKAGKLDDERRFRPDSKGDPTRVKTIVDAMMGIITGSKASARVLTTLLSVSLLGIVEGVPFVISVATIIWSRKTLADKARERDYLACVKMASVTTICTEKFEGLTEYENEVDKFYVGQEYVCESSVVAPNVLDGLCDGIGTLFLMPQNDCPSKLKHIIRWAETKLGLKRESVIEHCKMIKHSGYYPLQERCQVVMENGNGEYLHCKGPPEDILSLCTHQYGIDGKIHELHGPKRRMLAENLRYMQAEEAEVIAFACKRLNDLDMVSVEPKDLILLAMISLKETKMEETKGAISSLKESGIRTILASGDDVAVLARIGQNYGLLTPDSDDLVLTAKEFMAWTDEERQEKVEKICIMGNCLPSDKILLINCLREKGQVVALIAQRTIDAPVLKQADIGLAVGTWSSEVARKSCGINIWDVHCLNFLVTVIKNGRCFQENIRKFIQLQLIITISSLLVNFAAIVFLGDAPLTAIQLLWLNLVVALAGLALLTGPSTNTITTMMSGESSAELITKAMWRNIAIQASYQTTIFLALQHKGHAILGTSGDHVKSIIYNGFFLCQMFNKFIAREPEKKNIFKGIFRKNYWFWVALVFLLTCQAVFVVVDQVLGSSPGLNFKLWGVCILIGIVSWLLDLAGKIASNLMASWAAVY